MVTCCSVEFEKTREVVDSAMMGASGESGPLSQDARPSSRMAMLTMSAVVARAE
jgi:hypothetical protein